MKLRFVLISEGSTEAPLVGHLEELCRREIGQTPFESIDGRWGNLELGFLGISKDVGSRARALLDRDEDIDLLFIHRDADGRDPEPRRRREIATALLPDGRYVAVVPVQETEAWLLVDEHAIREATGHTRGRIPLALPKLKHIEDRADPKMILREALSRAAGMKPGRLLDTAEFNRLRRALVERLDLDGPVNELPSWQQLLADIHQIVLETVTTRLLKES